MYLRVVVICLLSLFILPNESSAQKRAKALENLGKFDTRVYHFGVQLSMNNADFFVERRFDPLFADSVVSFQNFSRPGFNIAIISELHFTKNLGIRFIPGISPKERILQYRLLEEDGQVELFEKSVRSFYIDFPLNLKYRSDRIKNFAVYALAGAQFSRDMASQER